jgi:hypothetical protein
LVKEFNSKYVCRIILLAALSVICACVLWKADWTFDYFAADDWQFITKTAIGKPSCAFVGGYRFWPLGLCDYTILLFVPYGETAMAHYIYNCIMMIFSVLMMLSLLKRITRNNYIISLFSLLILFSISSFMLVHIMCIFPERMIFFMFSAFMLCSFMGYKKQSSLHYFIAFLAATYAIFLKEPVFGTIAIIALINLIFSKSSAKDKIFNCALLASSFSYVAIYVYRLLYRDNGTPYASTASSISELSFGQFRSEPILYLTAIVVCARIYALLIEKDRSQIFTDSLLLGGFGYAIAYSIFGLPGGHQSYYVLPAVVLFIPSFAISILKNEKYRFVIIGISILCSAITINTSKKHVLATWKHRKEDHLFFEHVVREWRSGKDICWLSDRTLDHNSKYRHSVFIFSRYNMFFHYYGGEKCFLMEIFDPSAIDKNSLVLCHEEIKRSASWPAFSKKIKECELELIATMAQTHLYMAK